MVEKLGVGREMVNGVNTGKGAFAEAASPKTKISRSSSSHANEPRQSPRWRGKFSDLPWSTENAGYAGLHLEGPGRSLPERGKGVGPLGRRLILTWMRARMEQKVRENTDSLFLFHLRCLPSALGHWHSWFMGLRTQLGI